MLWSRISTMTSSSSSAQAQRELRLDQQPINHSFSLNFNIPLFMSSLIVLITSGSCINALIPNFDIQTITRAKVNETETFHLNNEKKKIKKVTQQSNIKFERQLPTPLSKTENYLMAAQVLGSSSPCNYTQEMHTQYPQDHWHCPFVINKPEWEKNQTPTNQKTLL